MKGFPTDLLSKACRIFLTRAYPEGETSLAPHLRPFWAMSPDQPLDTFLEMKQVCEKLLDPQDRVRGYAFRLGSSHFPHLKLQVTALENGEIWVFSVDTHDSLRCAVSAAEREVWARIREENRCLKDKIEQEWEKQGLTTFKTILRRGLGQPSSSAPF
jgi:hypothetical protein